MQGGPLIKHNDPAGLAAQTDLVFSATIVILWETAGSGEPGEPGKSPGDCEAASGLGVRLFRNPILFLSASLKSFFFQSFLHAIEMRLGTEEHGLARDGG